jgi:DNA-binding NarL/FixJ family response regulator
MFKAGASGYLLKNCAFDELADAIRIVYSNHKYISPELMSDAFIENYVHDFVSTAPPAFSLFSEQEKRIFTSFKSGKTLEQISDELNMDINKIRQCLTKLLKQLNLEYIEDFTKTIH